jgi:hypothetical protein
MCDTDGHIPRAWFRRNVWQPALAAADIGLKVRVHDLRHAHASWLIAGGADLQSSRSGSGTEAYGRPRDIFTRFLTRTKQRSMLSAGFVTDQLASREGEGTPPAPDRGRTCKVKQRRAGLPGLDS